MEKGRNRATFSDHRSGNARWTYVVLIQGRQARFLGRMKLFRTLIGIKLMPMKRRALRIFVLLWLGWYVSGPAAEMVDFWDSPRQEMHDIARAAGGMVALIGTAIAIMLSQIGKLCERLRLTNRPVLRSIAIRIESALHSGISILFHPSHAPPIQLRI